MMKTEKSLIALIVLTASSGALAQASPDAGAGRGNVQLAPLSVKSGITGDRSVARRAPAPPLSNVTVYGVGSTQYGGYEYPPQGAFSTTGDHGGTALRVAVWEQGYANTSSRIAKMNGTQLPNAYLETPLCGTSTSVPQACPTGGGTITGYLVYYNLDGYQSGSFTFQATSLVFPYTARNTSINIK